MLDMVVLKNGAKEVAVLVSVTMRDLRELRTEDIIAFDGLVMKCRDGNHKLFGNTEEFLKSKAMLERNGQPYNVVKNIVLSAVTGDGLDKKLGSPLAVE